MNNISFRVGQHPFAKPLSEAALKVISHGAREEVFKPGQVILRAGEPANSLYLIEEGKVAIESQERGKPKRTVQTIGAGMTLGWSWLFAPFTWRLQAHAVEQTRAVRLDGGHVLAQCGADPKIGYEIMKRVSQVVIERLQSLAIQHES
jgi:CRP/FNR family transcriptional regulator, cyclic AMP receptor protein